MTVFLVGFMGSGKSFVGKKLAAAHQLNFLDLDDYILQAYFGADTEGGGINQIFDEKGETFFREFERKCLLEVLNMPDTVIATGGGAPCFFDNMDLMNTAGTTIFLDVEIPILVQRLENEADKRPLLRGVHLPEFIEKKMRERRVFYEKAHIIWRVNTDNMNVLPII